MRTRNNQGPLTHEIATITQYQRPRGIKIRNPPAILLLLRIAVRDGREHTRARRGSELFDSGVHEGRALAVPRHDELGGRTGGCGTAEKAREGARFRGVAAAGLQVGEEARAVGYALDGDAGGPQGGD